MKLLLALVLVVMTLECRADDAGAQPEIPSVGQPGGQVQESRVRPFGHNISSTSYVLDRGQCTLGLVQAVACGVTDRLSIGTSPWLDYSYNMYSALMRLQVGDPTQETRQAIQFAYIKNYLQALGYYEMEMGWVTYVKTYFIEPGFVIHLNLQGMYYWDDAYPFSLRRPWVDRRPFQLNSSILNEIHLSGRWYVNAETGFLGLIQSNPNIIFALSFEYRTNHWLAHFGASQTGTLTAFASPTDRFDVQQKLRRERESYKDYVDQGFVQYDYALHPEFSVQYYF